MRPSGLFGPGFWRRLPPSEEMPRYVSHFGLRRAEGQYSAFAIFSGMPQSGFTMMYSSSSLKRGVSQPFCPTTTAMRMVSVPSSNALSSKKGMFTSRKVPSRSSGTPRQRAMSCSRMSTICPTGRFSSFLVFAPSCPSPRM